MKTTANSTFAIVGVSCSALTLVIKISPIANLQNIKKLTSSITFRIMATTIFSSLSLMHNDNERKTPTPNSCLDDL